MKRIVVLLVALQAPMASAVYRCVDSHGTTLFGDVPPAACADVPIYEISKSGMVVRRIDPTPTPEQVKERLEAKERQKAAERAAAEQLRKDMALLNSYGSPEEFDVARDRNIEPVKGRIASAQERIRELDKRAVQIREQIDTYKGRSGEEAAAPVWLLADRDRVRKERVSLTQSIARDGKEVERLRAQYESDKQRWIALKADSGRIREAQPAPAIEAAKAPAKGAPGRY